MPAMRKTLSDPSRRNVALLALCQALSISTGTMTTATSPIVGHMLLGDDKTLATLPLFLVQLGIMAATVPASFLMRARGRRFGFGTGALICAAGGLVCTAGVYLRSFEVLCLGSFLQGNATGVSWYYRFAAADTASPSFRPKAISLVLAGGVLAGFLGPEAAKWSKDWLAPIAFAGIYLALAIFALVVLLIVQFLQIPKPTAEERSAPGRPLSVILAQPAAKVAVLAGMLGYATMTLLMSATPLAMLACGFAFGESATVIQAHVIAMFLPSFWTGSLIQRFGTVPVILAGALIEALCAGVNLMGIAFTNFIVGLSLLGLGWNFIYIGATALLTETYRPEERAKVQAFNDLLVYTSTAIAAGLSGILQAKVAWSALNMGSLPLMAVVAGAVAWLAITQRRARTAAE
jgi:MFS family permease